jgi:hypothetical protein
MGEAIAGCAGDPVAESRCGDGLFSDRRDDRQVEIRALQMGHGAAVSLQN